VNSTAEDMPNTPSAPALEKKKLATMMMVVKTTAKNIAKQANSKPVKAQDRKAVAREARQSANQRVTMEDMLADPRAQVTRRDSKTGKIITKPMSKTYVETSVNGASRQSSYPPTLRGSGNGFSKNANLLNVARPKGGSGDFPRAVTKSSTTKPEGRLSKRFVTFRLTVGKLRKSYRLISPERLILQALLALQIPIVSKVSRSVWAYLPHVNATGCISRSQPASHKQTKARR